MPELNDKEVQAIAAYCAYVIKYREGIATNNANIITTGVYIFAALATNVSVLAFLSVAFSTKFKILRKTHINFTFIKIYALIRHG